MTGSSVTNCKGKLERIGIKESQPRRAHGKRAIGSGGWSGWVLAFESDSHSAETQSAADRSRGWKRLLCWAHFDVARDSCLSIFLHSRFQRKLHFSFRAIGIEWEVKPRHGAGRTSGDELSSRSFKFFRGTELIKRAFLWHPYCWRQEKRVLISRNPIAALKRTGSNACSERKHRQTHGLQPESGNIQTMARAVNPMQGRVDLKQPVFPGWRSNPHTWWPSPFIPLKWPHVNRGSWSLFVPVASLWRVPEGLNRWGWVTALGGGCWLPGSLRAQWLAAGARFGLWLLLGEWFNLFGKLARRQRNWKGNVLNSFWALTFPHKR